MSDEAKIAAKLGRAQRRAIMNLGADFGPSGEHRACVRMWWRDDIPRLIDHKHLTDDCWSLRPLGLAVKAYLEARDGLSIVKGGGDGRQVPR